jgi:predicted membrane channel-forming protein YqfA (hemolysin III family)
MADRRTIRFVAGFIALCWIGIAALFGIVKGLAHILNNTILAVIVLQVIVYSVGFGFLGWVLYKSKSEREKWRAAKDGGGLAGLNLAERAGSEDRDDGWK